jgi:uncharacterized protein
MTLIVNGEKIDPKLIEQEITTMRPQYVETFRDQSREDQDKQLQEWAKENVIEKILIRQTAMIDPEPVSPLIIHSEYDKLVNEQGGEEAFLKQAGLTVEDINKVKLDIESRIRIERLMKRLNDEAGEVTEKESRVFYDQNKEQYQIPEQIRAAHIVVHTDSQTSVAQAKEKIIDAKQKLKNGRSFEDLANETSDCPGDGGDLGYFPRGHMVQKFEDVVFSMQPNQISDAFQTEFGFHIAKVYDKKPENLAHFDQVKDKIIQHLTNEKQVKTLENFIDVLREAADIQETKDTEIIESPFPILNQIQSKRVKPINSILVKPAGPDCNLDCTYCFYLQKSELFPEHNVHRMSEEVLEEMIRQVMTDGDRHITFGWQGGEPTLMGLPFFKQAIEFQNKYGNGQTVGNGLQTNGLLIDRDWTDFLKENHFLVGLSLDGPQHIHDHYRRKKGGQGSWEKVVQASELMVNGGVAVNALTVVNDYSVQYPKEIYEFHKSLGLMHHQYIPCVETDPLNPEKAASYSVSPEDYGNFLCTLFDLWTADFKDGQPATSIRYFDSVFHNYVGMPAPECTLMQECGVYIVVEHNGEVYSCDFFVEPEWKLGNIMSGKTKDMLNSDRQQQFGEMKFELPRKCKECQWLKYCWGGCTKDRIRDPQDKGLSHFCESYLQFFDHADSRMREFADRWKQHNNSEVASKKTFSVEDRNSPKIGRNEPCPCGSGKKYKKCCGMY